MLLTTLAEAESFIGSYGVLQRYKDVAPSVGVIVAWVSGNTQDADWNLNNGLFRVELTDGSKAFTFPENFEVVHFQILEY